VGERVLTRETPWSREYQEGARTFIFVSKFAKEGLQVAAAVVRDGWASWDAAKQLDFANAFILKPALTDEDHAILKFLMEAGSPVICATIAFLLPRYADRAAALEFLLDRAGSEQQYPGSYFQALGRIGDPRAVPVLRRRYERYRQTLPPFEKHGLHSELATYQQCCHALWKLERSAEYSDALKELLTHPDENIRRHSEMFLSGTP
jgi:hypothetical protein